MTTPEPMTDATPHAAAATPQRRSRRRTAAVAAVAAALLAGACTGGDDGAAVPAGTTSDAGQTDGETTTDGETVAVVDVLASPDADDVNRLLPETSDLVDVRPVEILDVRSAGDDADLAPDTVIVSFEMESHHCNGVRSTVTESDDEVAILLETGRLAGVEPTACTYGIYPYTVAVTLDSPLGDRRMVAAEPLEPAVLTDDEAASSAEAGGSAIGAGEDDPVSDSTDDPVEGSEGAANDSGVERPFGGAVPSGGAAELIGRHVEDGVEWAIENGVEWRILSYDGVEQDDSGVDDPRRLSFVVESDKIVSFEWS